MGSSSADFIKLNVDAAFHNDVGSGGWGVIGREIISHEICVAAFGRVRMMPDATHVLVCAT
jgi:hypothetical protein